LFSKVVQDSAAPELQSRNRPAFRLPLFGLEMAWRKPNSAASCFQ
jgi:hypothetical protein